MGREAAFAALASLVLGGCAVQRSEAGQGAPLAGTEWLLIGERAGPGVQPREAPLGKYRLALDRSGTMSIQVDCNRGAGSWRMEPLGPSNGRLQFGPIAVTEALCNDEGLGERVAASLGRGGTYSLYDGRMTFSTADGAVLTFEPVD
jgi:para-nitrobenzyl esterase